MAKQIALLLMVCAAGILNTKAAPTTSALHLRDTEAPQDKTLFKYDIQINVENGQTLEKIEINTQAKTELIRVKNGNGEEIEVLEDYSKNLSVIHIKAKHICYVSKMKSLPDKFDADLENQTIAVDNDTSIKVETTTWKVKAVLTQRSLLSEQMAAMCARSSIFWIQRTDGTGSARQSRDTDHSRARRSLCMTNIVCVPVCQLRIVITNGKKKLGCVWVRRCSIVTCN